MKGKKSLAPTITPVEEAVSMITSTRRAGYEAVGSPLEVDASPHAAASPQSQRRAILRAGLLSGLVATVGSLAMCGLFYATVLKPAQNSLAAATLQMQERNASIRGGAVVADHDVLPYTPVLKKKGKKGKKKALEGEEPADDALMCEADPNFAKKTLKLVQEETMFALFGEQSGSTAKYEASDVIVKGDYYYVICDSSWSIYRVRKDMPAFSTLGNLEILHMHNGDLDTHGEDEDSSYEALFYDHQDEIFYLVRESLPHPDADAYHAVIEEVRLTGDSETPGDLALLGDAATGTLTQVGDTTVHHQLIDSCPTEDLFNGDSKGLEGVIGMRGGDGTLYLLGLCEGNHCEQRSENGLDKGNGIVVVMRKIKDAQDGFCSWITVSHLHLPSSVDFTDYSAISFNPTTGLVAITSQEDSRLWVGKLVNPSGSFDPHASYFDEGRMFAFPPNYECETIYCNIEGVHWISENMVVAVSDQAKKGGKQDFRCRQKDQSVHVFLVPL